MGSVSYRNSNYGENLTIMSKTSITSWLAFGIACAAFILPSQAQDICDLFSKNTLYKSDEGFVKKVKIGGRYQGQYILQDEEIDNEDNDFEDWQNRRARLALSVELPSDLTLNAEVNFAKWLTNEEGPFIDTFQDLNLEWETDDHFLRVGKQKQLFTIEDANSSKRMKTIERSAIVNETAGARPWGAIYGFEAGGMEHLVGGWLYGGQDGAPEWLDFDSNGGFSYNGTRTLNDTTKLKVDYVYADNDGGDSGSEGDAANGFGPAYEHAFSVGTISDHGDINLVANAILGLNRTGSGDLPAGNDTWGFYVMPSYDISEKLELVGRYAYMDEGREQRTQRYDERVEVEQYHTLYGGLQYKICGDKLKLMGGYEYAIGEVFGSGADIDTGSLQLGVRTYF